MQGLLKKVYQESCRILTLSQRRTASSTQLHVSDLKVTSLNQTQHHSEDGSTELDHQDKSSSNPPMSWQQEKRALQETVIALRELLCRMAQRHSQVRFCGFKSFSNFYKNLKLLDNGIIFHLFIHIITNSLHLIFSKL